MSAKRDNRSCLDFQILMDKRVYVKLVGGREGLLYAKSRFIFFIVEGILRGFDHQVNFVLDDCVEYLTDGPDGMERTRKLGLLVVKGTAVMAVNPMQGMTQIENPFITA